MVSGADNEIDDRIEPLFAEGSIVCATESKDFSEGSVRFFRTSVFS